MREWLNGSRDYASGVKLYQEHGDDPLLIRMFAEPESEFKKKKLVAALQGIWDNRKGPKQAVSTPKPIQSPSKPVPFTIKRELVKSKKEIDRLDGVVSGHEQTIEDLEWEKDELEEEKDELVEANEELERENKELKKTKSRNGWPLAMDETLTAIHAQWKEKFLTMVDLQSRIFEVGLAGKKDLAKEKEAGVMALQILDLREQVISIYRRRDHYLEHGKLPDDPSPVLDCLDPIIWPVKLANAERYVREYKAQMKEMDPASKQYEKKLRQLDKWQTEVSKYKKLLKKD